MDSLLDRRGISRVEKIYTATDELTAHAALDECDACELAKVSTLSQGMAGCVAVVCPVPPVPTSSQEAYLYDELH